MNLGRLMEPREVAMRGAVIRVADDQPTFWDRVAAGTWEPETLDWIEGVVRPGATFFDLGAWVGPTALFAASRGAAVVAVEADPAALDQLRRNLAANPDLAAAITLVPRALSATGEPVAMGARRKPGDSMSSALLAGRDGGWTAQGIAPAALFAQGVAQGVAPGSVAKLDIEGGEFALLPALVPALPREIAVLRVSFHPALYLAARGLDAEGFAAAASDALAPLAGWDCDTEGDRVAGLVREIGLNSTDRVFTRRA